MVRAALYAGIKTVTGDRAYRADFIAVERAATYLGVSSFIWALPSGLRVLDDRPDVVDLVRCCRRQACLFRRSRRNKTRKHLGLRASRIAFRLWIQPER